MIDNDIIATGKQLQYAVKQFLKMLIESGDIDE